MYPWQIIVRDIKRVFHRRRVVMMDEETIMSLRQLADIKKTTPEEVLGGLVEAAFKGKEPENLAMQYWLALSDREKRVSALICAGWPTEQIAARLGVAPSTVKTYVKKIFVKFHVHDRKILREMLASYDLSEFE